MLKMIVTRISTGYRITRSITTWPFRTVDKLFSGSANIYGALRLCKKEDWIRGFNELVVTLIFGLFPVWVPVLLHWFIGDQSWALVYKQIKDGQLFFLATALLAPIFYFTFPAARRPGPDGVKPFPSQQILIAIFLGTVIASALAIAVAEFPQAHENGRDPQARMVSISIWLFAFSSILYFLTLVVRNWLESGGVEEILDEQSREQDRRSPVTDRSETPAATDDELVARTLAEHATQ